jgi:hypothetical protein
MRSLLALSALVAWGGTAAAAERPLAPVTARLQAALERAGSAETTPVWVFFRDKEGSALATALTPRAV